MVEGRGRIKVNVGNKEFVTIEVRGKRLDVDVTNLAAGRGLIIRMLPAIASGGFSEVSSEVKLLSVVGELLERKGYMVDVKIAGEAVARMGVAARHNPLGPVEVCNLRWLLRNLITSFLKFRV